MTLMLHAGANIIEYAALRELETPPATPTLVPVEHYRVVDLLKSTLGMYGHEVTDEHHGVTPDPEVRPRAGLGLKSTLI